MHLLVRWNVDKCQTNNNNNVTSSRNALLDRFSTDLKNLPGKGKHLVIYYIVKKTF